VTNRLIAVLSGGGVKTAAHLGALRVLFARGMVPDRYVGTSMGAVLATGLAAGLSPGEAIERLLAVRQRDIFAVDRGALIRGVWAKALLNPDRLRRTLERLVPVSSFAELQVPLSVTATDLDTGEELVFGAGGEDVPIIDALCASCALPLFFPPFVLNGRRCADGGLREVVPLAVAARFATAMVVAVDVGSGFDMQPSQSGKQPPALIRLQNDAQRILFASNTALSYALWKATLERPPLLWIRPKVRLGETFATEQLQYYIEEGERAAVAALGASKP
jgi:NTE family protein